MIAHIDADAFFASVEQAVNPGLKGRPVVTGKERNIVAAASYEAKAFGVKRGVALWDARKMCPGLVVLPTDYETVSLFSKRMFDIMRRYTPTVEEYGVDEGFLDLTGLRRLHKSSYENIARRIQTDIHKELNITVSVGLSVSKVLAKIGSKKHKPAGFTIIRQHDIKDTLQNMPVGDVWNIGPATAALLKQYGLSTAWQFAQTPLLFLERILTKPGLEVWQELNGQPVMPVTCNEKTGYQTISKTKTFTPPSNAQTYVLAQLVKNMENACIKARRHHQAAQRISIFLKRNDYRAFGLEAKLIRPSAFPAELLPVVKKLFLAVYQPRTLYRATGVILSGLTASDSLQPTLFESAQNIQKIRRLYAAVDQVRQRYGKHAVHHAVSLPAKASQHLTARGDTPRRKLTLLPDETARQRLPLPLLQVKI